MADLLVIKDTADLIWTNLQYVWRYFSLMVSFYLSFPGT